jgi:6,7-dimethyl-8-ribityllumazine synthase
MKVKEGMLDGKGKKFAIVVSRFNEAITSRLLEGALDCLKRHNVKENDVEVVWVPGSFEIPWAANLVAKKKDISGIICLGAVIRGDTPHFEYIAAQVTRGISQIALTEKIPVSYGIITADNTEQAMERAGTKKGNKGWQAALSALETASLAEQL